MKYKLIPITSLDQLQVGDLIQSERYVRRVIDKTPHLVALSSTVNLESCSFHAALYDLEGWSLQVTDEPWKPKEGEVYFYPDISNGVSYTIKNKFIINNCHHKNRHTAGLCFKTIEEALAAAQKMLDAIKPNQL